VDPISGLQGGTSDCRNLTLGWSVIRDFYLWILQDKSIINKE
jgi:hypothetical protein